MNENNAHMMYDEYNLWVGVLQVKNPADVVATLNFSLFDSNDEEVEQRAMEMAYRLKLAIALFSNIRLTNQYLENILFSTGTRIPEPVNVRELPPALK